MGNFISRDGDCQPCFFLEGVRKKVASRETDPIGTPLPETPLYQRRKRAQIQEVMRQRHPVVFSSTYNGLEKEVEPNQNNMLPDEDNAQIHEDTDCEELLHEKYQIMEALGVGSTSTVYRALCRADGQYYACKVIDCQLIEERFQGMMEQFQTEIEALRKLRHPGIIRLYDVYISPQKIYIVMELMEGGELFDYVVQKGTLTEDEAAKIVRDVTSALVYMHENNIVHRDLKPENLLLKRKPTGPSDDIEVKIIDFGLSKVSKMVYFTTWSFTLCVIQRAFHFPTGRLWKNPLLAPF